MEGGPPSFTPGSSYRALLRNSTSTRTSVLPTGLSPSLAPHSRGLRLPSRAPSVRPTTPHSRGVRFGLGPVRSPLLRASRLISLPAGTEMFQFPAFALHIGVTGVPTGRVSPFGHPGLTGCVLLPPAYRSLPRPSSPPCAQASPTGLRSLDHKSRQARHAQTCRVMLFNQAGRPTSHDVRRPAACITVLIRDLQSLPTITCQTAAIRVPDRSPETQKSSALRATETEIVRDVKGGRLPVRTFITRGWLLVAPVRR